MVVAFMRRCMAVSPAILGDLQAIFEEGYADEPLSSMCCHRAVIRDAQCAGSIVPDGHARAAGGDTAVRPVIDNLTMARAGQALQSRTAAVRAWMRQRGWHAALAALSA